jgi:hypothetical protein
MSSCHTLVRTVLVSTAVAAGLAACGAMDRMKPGSTASAAASTSAASSSASASVARLRASLSGAAEVPPNDKNGKGEAEVTLNRDTGQLTYRVTYSGLSGPATGAHIHGPAAAGANAGIVVPFASPQSPISGEAKLNPTQVGDVLAGMYYVNVHTAAHPGGEIRGQLQLSR